MKALWAVLAAIMMSSIGYAGEVRFRYQQVPWVEQYAAKNSLYRGFYWIYHRLSELDCEDIQIESTYRKYENIGSGLLKFQDKFGGVFDVVADCPDVFAITPKVKHESKHGFHDQFYVVMLDGSISQFVPEIRGRLRYE